MRAPWVPDDVHAETRLFALRAIRDGRVRVERVRRYGRNYCSYVAVDTEVTSLVRSLRRSNYVRWNRDKTSVVLTTLGVALLRRTESEHSRAAGGAGR